MLFVYARTFWPPWARFLADIWPDACGRQGGVVAQFPGYVFLLPSFLVGNTEELNHAIAVSKSIVANICNEAR